MVVSDVTRLEDFHIIDLLITFLIFDKTLLKLNFTGLFLQKFRCFDDFVAARTYSR